MAQAHFTRTDTAEGARFDIRPASKPVSLSCMLIIAYGFTAMIMYFGAKYNMLGPFAILWLPLLVLSVIATVATRDKYPRVPVTLIVNHEGVHANGVLYPREAIAEFALRNTAGGGKDIWYNSRSMASTGGAAVAAAHQNVGWGLFARPRTSSTPVILAFGLTPDTARALLNDVSEAMGG
jgi:hypothetical protein